MSFLLAQTWVIAILLACYIVNTYGIGCYTCQNVPHPRDCGRIIECTADEECYVEKIVTSSGNVLYNSGCASQTRCNFQRKRDIQSDVLTSLMPSTNNGLQKRDDLAVCYECCNTTSYCNRNSCDNSVPSVSFVNRTTCLNCPNAESPDKCEFVSLCDVNEVCYTELVRINGEDRYRLGCVDPDACFMTDAATDPVLIGKKRFLVDPRISTYCGKCCHDKVSNCNRDLCRNGATGKPDTVGILKNPPPLQICEDIDTQLCIQQIQTDPDSCLNVTIANYVCRRTCKGCSSGSTSTGTGVVENLPMTDCFYDSARYQGVRRTSINRNICINWSLVYNKVPLGPGFPDTDIRDAENKCRDPTGKGHPWCYISEQAWEYCNVPFCEECYFKGNEKNFSGYTSKTSDNFTCLPWASYVGQLPINDDMFPDGSKLNAKNYCREFSVNVGIQCLTKDGFKPCGIPECPGPCTDDANTNCQLIKQFVCAREYSGKTLCPKTCGYCNVGLLPSIYVPTPTQICEDNVNASCPIVKDVICQNITAARILCPVTCNVGCGSGQVFPLTTRPPIDTWSVWGQWNCETTKSGVCFKIRYRACSSGNEKDCNGTHNEIKECDPVNCPDFSTLKPTSKAPPPTSSTTPSTTSTTSTTTTTRPTTTVNSDPCHDNTTCAALDVLGCNDQLLFAWLCPKACGFCGVGNCKDVFECGRPGVQDYFCSDDTMASKFCRKTCGKCNDPYVPFNVNQCGDPVGKGECTILNKELCICHDPDIEVLCHHYCQSLCNAEVFQDYSYCATYMGGKRSLERAQRIKYFLSQVRLA